jgi:hypothetical protein
MCSAIHFIETFQCDPVLQYSEAPKVTSWQKYEVLTMFGVGEGIEGSRGCRNW